MVDARFHDVFVDRLPFASDEVAVHVDIEVANRLHCRQGHVDEDVVNVEAMLWKFELDVAQHFRTIDDRVHEEILAWLETTDLIPCAFSISWENVTIANGSARAFIDLFIDVVAYDKISCFAKLALPAEVRHDLSHGFFIEPVVRINYLEITPTSIFETRVDGRTVAAILLMDCVDGFRVALMPFVSLLSCVVLRRAIVDNKNFDIAASIIASE